MSSRRQTLGVLSNRRHSSFEASLRQPTKSTRSRQSMASTSSSASRTNATQKRRQTLATSTRSSYGAGARKSAGGRKSLGGRQSLGRMSIAPKKKNADPRPIKKKSFMEQEVREVIRFLCHHNFDHPITPKQLTTPTAKDFENIVLFLFGVVDKHYVFSGNIRTDVALFYKGLGYPFTISTAALCAVGAPNTWPSMLGAVSWLIELLSYDDMVSFDDSDDVDGEQADKKFFRFLSASYTAFLSGEDDVFEKLSEELEDYFDARNNVIADEVKSADEKTLMLQDELKSLTEAESIIPSLQAQVAVLEGDITKHKAYMEKMEAYRDRKKNDVAAAYDKLNSLQSQAKELLSKKQRYLSVIDCQAYTVEEVQEMKRERMRKRKALETTQKEREAAQTEIWDIEGRRAAQIEELEQLTKEYNAFAMQLQMCPADAKFANGQDFSATLRIFENRQEPLNIDMKNVVKPYVKQLIDSVTMDAVETGKESLKLSERISELEEKKQEIMTSNKSLKATLDRQEHALAEEKTRLAQGVAEMQQSIDEIRIATTKLASSEVRQRKEIMAQRSQLHELQQQLVATCEETKQEEEALYEQVHQTTQLIADHEEQQQSTLKDLTSNLTARLQTMA